MKKNLIAYFLLWVFLVLIATNSFAQSETDNTQIEELNQKLENLRHRFDRLEKLNEDLLWFQMVGDVAFIDKVYITGPPNPHIKNPTAMGVDNPIKFWNYVFIPKNIDPDKKYPLLVFPHGGVHGDFTTYYQHIIREIVAQGYIVVAPEYRGSTGYGKTQYERIDYGGLENEDVYAARNWMIDNYEFVDKNRVGIIGWSHGGMIALMNIFDHPEDYQVAFAGVPVSDLISRMGYQTQDYRDLYSADYHIGKTAYEDVEEYKRRSPAWNAHKFQNTPLLIHTNTNDDDVNVLEVEHMIKSLKAENKKFEYEIYQDVEGGHSFDRIDTQVGQEIRVKIYKFLSQHLNPPTPIKSVKELKKAAYRF
ncbi:MAG: prolyl oligopeptidase family serine peptidase [Bacteroidales bacterium]|jgi:dipeptidyl aminopeptidase/acylaminoacyl peptidase|nr:prolyl oligopeptidase family serine peptidase [Bacteroidales bacterium]